MMLTFSNVIGKLEVAVVRISASLKGILSANDFAILKPFVRL